MTVVALNCAIATRGTSGSATALYLLRSALRSSTEANMVEVWPTRKLRRSRLFNAVAQAEWDLVGASRTARDADVLVSPTNIGRARAGQGHVLVLYDTTVLDHPDLFDPGYAMYARALFGWSVCHADHIIVPSRYTAARARAHWGPQLPITVAPLPVDVIATTERRLPDPKTILMVGASEPHKRQELSIRAVARARKETGLDLKLELVGPGGSIEHELRAAISRADADGSWIRRRCNVPAEALRLAYARAWVLLQPSLFEGYGLPVVEAASGGLPSIHSSAGALDEVAPSERGEEEGLTGYVDGLLRLLNPSEYRLASARAIAAAKRHTREAYSCQVLEAVKAVAPSRST